ncbi:hypothetical protein LZZ90_05385 [Flavobacterium sp. SM15]|uniref:hypothetical protein n=1 Tax=Flavobacterium sp. SM15 TaxID=2908005 RepID=UPI001EDB5DD2|nr:hypothetical protein [Flavobacterium sp. SM15]MCG2610933.1 hypothetical protein [Flavobacterium sp. SM15]
MKNIILVLALLLVSCEGIYKTVNGVNKDLLFENRSECVNYFNSNYNIETDRIFFIQNGEFGDFMSYIQREKVSYFYGITLNDKCKIDDPKLNENSSCYGRILSLMNNHDSEFKTKKTEISNFNFENIKGERIDFTNSKQIVFLLTTKFGKKINKDIEKLIHSLQTQQKEKNGYQYCLICVDQTKTI